MRFKTRLRPSHKLIDLTPLVDVIFLMLIFFIVTSDILPFKSLNIENPTLSQKAPPLTSQLLIVMDAQNVIFVGSKKAIVDLASLKDYLASQIEESKKVHRISPTLVLSIDRRVDYGSFLQLFAIAQQLGEKMRLVYKSEDQNPEL